MIPSEATLFVEIDTIRTITDTIVHNSNLKPDVHDKKLRTVEWNWTSPLAEGKRQESINALEYILAHIETACDVLSSKNSLLLDYKQLAEIIRRLKNSAWTKAVTHHHKGLKRRLEKLADRLLNKMGENSHSPQKLDNPTTSSENVMETIHHVAEQIRMHSTRKAALIGSERNMLADIHWKWSHSQKKGASYESKMTCHYIIEHIEKYLEELNNSIQHEKSKIVHLKETIENLRHSDWGQAVAHQNKDIKRRMDDLHEQIDRRMKEAA